jgi:hypothetical protein
MRVKIDDNLLKEDLFKYLRENKSMLIAKKTALPIVSDDLSFGYSKIVIDKTAGKKDNIDEQEVTGPEVDGEMPLDVIANVAGWCDSYMDVMIENNWNKSIKEKGPSGKNLVYHLKNHNYSTDSIVGKDVSLYTKVLDLSMFNIKSDITQAQALMMKTIVVEDYDEKTFMLYKDLQIKQHSIGLQYVKIYLCLNSEVEFDAEEKKNWDKYYPFVINKDKIDAKGYFWAVTESKILEVSAVLFGANELTTVYDGKSSTTTEPPKGTHEEPQFDITKALKQTKFIN